ncbi:MAG: hypothetical protein L0H37_09150 [Nitrosospira sp.]|nr:hypothetical protein [Nitrosospira sp.]
MESSKHYSRIHGNSGMYICLDFPKRRYPGTLGEDQIGMHIDLAPVQLVCVGGYDRIVRHQDSQAFGEPHPLTISNNENPLSLFPLRLGAFSPGPASRPKPYRAMEYLPELG